MSHLRIFLWHGHALFVGSGLSIPPHSHIAHQISVSLDVPFVHETEAGEVLTGSGFVAPSGVPHGFDSRESARQIVVWCEPQTWEGSQLESRYPTDRISTLDRETVDRVRQALGDIDLYTGGAEEAALARSAFWHALTHERPKPSPTDPRIVDATEYYFRNRSRDVSVGEVARHVALSESHFSRLFSESVGVPPSRYRLWMRSLEACRLLADGASVTEAAHAAGFADAAHFSRTFNRLLGSGGPRSGSPDSDVNICDDHWNKRASDDLVTH